MAVPTKILELVERFDRNLRAHKQASYNEAQAGIELIDPLFKALGWDMDNEQGYSQAYQQVIYEDAIKVAGGTKAPDYCFRIGGIEGIIERTSVDCPNCGRRFRVVPEDKNMGRADEVREVA